MENDELKIENAKLKLMLKKSEEALEFYSSAFDRKLTSSMMGEYVPFNVDRGAYAKNVLDQINKIRSG